MIKIERTDIIRWAQRHHICTCDDPCCRADIEVGIVTCGNQHCPTHGLDAEAGTAETVTR